MLKNNEKELRGYKYRIYPTEEQIKIFEKSFYVNDLIWNKLLGGYVDFNQKIK